MSISPSGSGRDRLLDDLNPAQREAVVHGAGPLLVVAGAGTGKTRVLTHRVAWLVAGGLPAYAVLAITFTNKAADVLVRRLDNLLPGQRVQAGTFHSFCARALRTHGDALGISRDYTVLDREDQRRLLKSLVTDLGLDAGAYRPAPLASMISHVKNGGGGRPPLDLSSPDDEASFHKILQAYTKRLRVADLLDFDDLLLEGLRLLTEVDEVGALFRRRYAHVLVDEYQDTNLVQAELLRALLSSERNLCAVGDPDQSIYRWRGAVVRNILEFETEYPGARKILLERNYRSTGRILDAAEHVIARNEQRHEKRLYTEREEGAALRVVRCRDADDEAEVIAQQITTWQGLGYAYDQMAVFYRVNSLSRALEMALRARRLPYVVVAGVEFFQRREVKDLLAYARLVENPNDEAAFLRIANVPRRGVGDASLKRLRAAALDQDISSVEAARRGSGGISGRAKKGLQSLTALLDEARAMPRAPVAALLDWLADASGYRAWIAQQEETVEGSRLDNVDELIAFARSYDDEDVEQDAGELARDLGAFLEQTVLVSDQDAYEEDGGRVSLMSVHAAKGLEFPCVAIAGAEDELFPHARNAEDPSGEEEERRLFYVAMTRAMERLALTYAARRFDWRGDAPRLPSPYLKDVPAALVERDDRAASWATPSSFSFKPPRDEGFGFVRESEAELAIGERVRHPYFGEGRLADLHGAGANLRATVDFDQHGRKQLLLSHARLERCQ